MWFVYAIFAAAIWGLDYAVGEKVLRSRVSPVSLLTLQMGIGFLVFLLVGNQATLKSDLRLIWGDRRVFWLFFVAVTGFNLGNLLIFLSIQAKNATLAGLVELCYPLFTVLFLYLVFNEVQFNLGVLIGGILVMTGVGIVTWYG